MENNTDLLMTGLLGEWYDKPNGSSMLKKLRLVQSIFWNTFTVLKFFVDT